MLKPEAIETIESAREELKQYWAVCGDLGQSGEVKHAGEKENDFARKLRSRNHFAHTITQLVEAVMMNTLNHLKLDGKDGNEFYEAHRENMGNHVLDSLLGK